MVSWTCTERVRRAVEVGLGRRVAPIDNGGEVNHRELMMWDSDMVMSCIDSLKEGHRAEWTRKGLSCQ